MSLEIIFRKEDRFNGNIVEQDLNLVLRPRDANHPAICEGFHFSPTGVHPREEWDPLHPPEFVNVRIEQP